LSLSVAKVRILFVILRLEAKKLQDQLEKGANEKVPDI
jgi:hypothetical protein